MADHDDRGTGDSVKMIDYIVIVDVVCLIENHDEWVFDGVTEELGDVGGVPRKLLADLGRMLAECLAEDRTGTLAQASDMGVRDRSTVFGAIECVARKHRFPDTARPADQSIMGSRSRSAG